MADKMMDGMSPAAMMPNEDTLQKFTGNPAIEVHDATYRVAARLLVDAVQKRAVDQLNALGHGGVANLLKGEAGEAIIGFALAAVLELVPASSASSLMDKKRTLAYNLRVESYAELEELLLHSTGIVRALTGVLDEEVEKAMRSAGVDAARPAPKTYGVPGAARGSDGAGAVVATAAG
jgi:hypothetical protein